MALSFFLSESGNAQPAGGKPPSVAPRAAGIRMVPSWPAPWIARWEWRMRALARRRNCATLLSEAPVRGPGQSPGSDDRKSNSYSISKSVDWLIVKSCGFTTRKADESGTVPPSEPAQVIPGRAFVHRPLASARETAKTWLCRSSSAWPGPPRSPGRARETFPDSLASDDPRSEHVAHCNGHCRRFFRSLCRRARCPGRDARKEGST